MTVAEKEFRGSFDSISNIYHILAGVEGFVSEDIEDSYIFNYLDDKYEEMKNLFISKGIFTKETIEKAETAFSYKSFTKEFCDACWADKHVFTDDSYEIFFIVNAIWLGNNPSDLDIDKIVDFIGGNCATFEEMEEEEDVGHLFGLFEEEIYDTFDNPLPAEFVGLI